MKLEVAHSNIGRFAFALRRGRSTTLGRFGSQADIELNWDDAVSRRHARVWLQEGQIWFEDLGSRNGSWLNGMRIDGRVRFEPGMLIRVGDTKLRVQDQLARRSETGSTRSVA